jgi:hypothetical protein
MRICSMIYQRLEIVEARIVEVRALATRSARLRNRQAVACCGCAACHVLANHTSISPAVLQVETPRSEPLLYLQDFFELYRAVHSQSV